MLKNQIDDERYVETLVISGDDDTVLLLFLFSLPLLFVSSYLHAASARSPMAIGSFAV